MAGHTQTIFRKEFSVHTSVEHICSLFLRVQIGTLEFLLPQNAFDAYTVNRILLKR